MEFLSGQSSQKIGVKVIGVGGCGGNVVKKLAEAGAKVDLVVANTDQQALDSNPVRTQVRLGANLLHGRGAGKDPEAGRQAAEESAEELKEQLAGASLVFVTAGMGGGTGTGAAPVVARIAQEAGAMVIGVVTMPFKSEGPACVRKAKAGQAELEQYVNNLLLIPNDKVRELPDVKDLSYDKWLAAGSDILVNTVFGISNIVRMVGVVNTDMNDIRWALTHKGKILLGCGEANGADKGMKALEMALHNNLLDEYPIHQANNVLLHVIAGKEIPGNDMINLKDSLSERIGSRGNDNYEVKEGFVLDESMGDNIRITLLGSGEAEPEVPVFENLNTSCASKYVEKQHLLPTPAMPIMPSEPVEVMETMAGSVNSLVQGNLPNMELSENDKNTPPRLRGRF